MMRGLASGRAGVLAASVVAAMAVASMPSSMLAQALDPATLPQVSYHPGGIAYWDTPYFANAMANGGFWMEYAPNTWGTAIASWNTAQFDENGNPRFLNPGMRLRALLWGLHVGYGSARPSTWAYRGSLGTGRVVLTWQGDADVRLDGAGTFVAAGSSGGATGRLVNGRRVYQFQPGNALQWLEVHDINASSPVTDLKVWLPDPANPTGATLEGQLFHPTFLARLNDAPWGYIRFMNWTDTNASPEQDWGDRRRPSHVFMGGVMNPRPPATGFSGNRSTGAPYEVLVALCNATNKDLYVCLPHLATEDSIRRVARTIRFGSDGTDPYSSPQANPVWAPLAAGRRVFVEYSNEIWSNGGSFPQGNWAQEQATALGITKAQFNARRFCETWRLFQQEFGGTSRLVRVAAVWTGQQAYTSEFLQEIATYGPALTPAVEPDVIAATTYFGNGIQDWVMQRAQATAGTASPWFLTTATFDAGGGQQRPVSLPATDPYWTGATFAGHIEEAFGEWRRRMLSGSSQQGGGFDSTGIGGGFDGWLRQMALTTFPTPKPIIAYEGGPSLYTDYMDGGDSRDDGVTMFLEAMNRSPRFAEMYRMHLNMAKAKGLRTHSAFTDVSAWGKYGQWGHLESLDQSPATSPKWQFLLDWIAGQGSIRHIDSPMNAVPSFATAAQLPVAVYGTPYSADIVASGGNGTLSIERIGDFFVPGMGFATVPGDPARVRMTGTPTDGGISYLYLRATDADGDPVWQTFRARSVGGPLTLLEGNFEGTNPAQNLPWTGAYILAPSLGYGGVTRGTGIIPVAGNDAVVWSVNAPANEADSTLALAVTDQEYIGVTVTPPPGQVLDLAGREVRLTIRRQSWHAPRRYAVMTSVGGFAAGSEVFTTNRSQEETDLEYRFTLPSTPGFDGIAGPFSLRIYGFQGQYGGHATSLRALRLDGVMRSVAAEVRGWGEYR